MNKTRKIVYGVFIAVTVGFFAMILLFSKDKEASSEQVQLKERRGTFAMSAEWLNTKTAIEGLLISLENNPENTKIMVQLAQAYIQESRVTGDHAFYDKAALDMTDKVLAVEPNNFEALCCQGTVLLSQHHFADALVVAQKAQQVNPASAFVYGMLCDANVELGNYEEAVKMCDKMVSLRPDTRSYSRVSYLREIHGDIPGAIEAMKLAVAAGYAGLEQTEWCRIILGQLYEQTSSMDSAKYCYELAQYNRTDYPFALAGLARIEKAKGNNAAAIAWLEKANLQISEYSFYEELAELYAANGEKVKADSAMATAIAMLGPGETDNEAVIGHGHYADRELALAYARTGEYDKAIMHAITEYNRRPNNIDICETLAWVYYKAGKYYLAEDMMRKALRTGKKNPETLCRAGLIQIHSGFGYSGKRLLNDRAIASNPFIDHSLKEESAPYIAATHN
ncbi:MAG TPA: tetratricopeptide repeat protein [Bacteroidia bacterium]|nr:tetratricopeptide repeat protein [Bacteroidia bacterium]